jgi:GT2 family glycosyltransferase
MIPIASHSSSPTPRPVCILIPAYGAADKLRRCLESLIRFAPPRCKVYVIDDATPDDSVHSTCLDIQKSWPELGYHRNHENLGFVRTCNWGVKNLRSAGSDLLLLNSDVEVTSGFMDEMQTMLHVHEKHGVVVPRSNNATIFSFPWIPSTFTADESYKLWENLRHLLPRYQLMPTAVGFCMLIKGEVLDRFELFDEVYSPGYNEENDFICRINRHGYSVVASNWAYVYHHEGSSFGQRRGQLEERNRQTLVARYPEYERKISDYVRFQMDPVEVFAHLYRPHRPRVLFDLFHLPRLHSGTSEFALNLLRETARLLERFCELHVGIGEAFSFFAQDLTGYRRYDDRPGAQTTFDVVFKPSQIFSWNEFRTMNRMAPRLAYVLQDIIGVRCDYLSSADRQILFRKTAELSDCVIAISDFTRADFNAYYGIELPMRTIHHGTDFGVSPDEFRSGEYVFVMGNHFPHKAVADALRHLGQWQVVVLGGKPDDDHPPQVRWLTSGGLGHLAIRELFINARVVVYPSHYEGFGLPVVDALALRKPVIVLDTAVSREIAKATANQNLHLIPSFDQLDDMVGRLFESGPRPEMPRPRRWCDVAQDYADAIKDLLASEVNTSKLRLRWDTLRLVESVSS